MLRDLRKLLLTEEFDYNFLIYALSQYKNPRVKINDLLKKGDIIRVKKGLYIFGKELAHQPYSKEILANLIYGPSYISLEYALSYYGLIPERIETVTSIVNKRNKFFNTPIGTFSYRYIHPSLFSYGITLQKKDNLRTFLIATKEKAVSDMLYFSDTMSNQDQIERYVCENLRIDKTTLKKFNKKTLKKLASLYGHNVSLFYGLLRSFS